MIKKLIRNIIHAKGYKLVPTGLGYIDPKQTVPAAKNENLSVAEYLEKHDIGGVGKRRDKITESLFREIQHSLKGLIVEIGTGTGMYMEKIHTHYKPSGYEVYETNLGWKEYLSNHYSGLPGLTIHNADGTSLQKTKANSADAVFAHGVFVYLPLLTTMGYLQECVRVGKKGSFIVFDCFLDDFFSYATVLKWQNDPHKYDFPVVLSRKLLVGFFETSGLELVGEFNIPYHSSESTYFITRKK